MTVTAPDMDRIMQDMGFVPAARAERLNAIRASVEQSNAELNLGLDLEQIEHIATRAAVAAALT